MSSPRPDWVDRIDERILHGWYVAVSVHAGPYRTRLRLARRPFVEPNSADSPGALDLAHTAQWAIAQSRATTGTVSGIAGLGGFASVPPEVVASVVSILRLGQRLTIIYGLDPHTDRGRMALWRALAAGLQLELPEQGPVGLRLSDIPTVLTPSKDPRTVGAALLRAMLKAVALMVAGRTTRFVPVLSSGLAAYDASQRQLAIGQRMAQCLARESGAASTPLLEDAVEIEPES